jgi:hypothetical protein
MEPNQAFLGRCFMSGHECSKQKQLSLDPKKVFIVMPFQGKDNVFFAVKDAVEKGGYYPHKGDREPSNIMIPCKVCYDIQSSPIIIGDISENNPNVFFELGLAFALGRTVRIIADRSLGTPADLAGLEYIQYDTTRMDRLSEALQGWFKQLKSERYQYDQYLLGHLLKIEKMALTLDNFNDEGDTKTRYDITVRKIGISETDEDLFAMPYHDSVSVDVPEAYFALQVQTANGCSLDVKRIIFSTRLKRFCVVLEDMAFEEQRSFSVTMKEKQLFDQLENEDWYEVNITCPTEQLTVEISINPAWRVKRGWVSYGESTAKVRSELVALEFEANRLFASFTRPRVGVTYMLRWEWEIGADERPEVQAAQSV